MRSLISIRDLDPDELATLVDAACEFGRDGLGDSVPLAGKTVGIYFRHQSTRTRTAFTAAAQRLGAHVIVYGPEDLQTTTGETIEDTGRVLSEYLDLFVVRTNEDIAEIRALDASGPLGVVNALTRDEHPTQAIGDLATMQEARGELAGLHLLYVGEGNSTAAALALSIAKVPGMRMTLATPAGYGLPSVLLEEAIATAARHGAEVALQHELDSLPRPVDFVYTSRWKTMGVAKGDPDWEARFAPYRVTAEMVESVADRRTLFLHDLPAVRGGDVDDEVLDGSRSRAWRQAHHKMTSAMAILAWCGE